MQVEDWVGKCVWVEFQYKLGEAGAYVLLGVDNRGVYLQRIVEFEVSPEFVARQKPEENWVASPEKLASPVLVMWRSISKISPQDKLRGKYL